jgi:Zn-dependent protease
MKEVFVFLVLIISAVIHEVSHGAVAYALGDPTAKMRGRLTLNPIPHLDWYGSIILPLFFLLLPGGFFFAYAKPVPYNPYNLRNQRWGPAIVAAAGPLSNLFLAVGMAIIYKVLGIITDLSVFYELVYYVVFINIILGVFNAVPIPPLDGSKILMALFSRNKQIMEFYQLSEKWGMMIVLAFAFFIFPILVQGLRALTFWILAI